MTVFRTLEVALGLSGGARFNSDLNRAASNVSTSGAKMSQSMKGAGASSQQAAAMAGSSILKYSAALAIGTAAAVAFAKKSVSSFMDAGLEVLKLQRYTGDTAENTSRLRFAAQQTGTDVDGLARSLGIASKQLTASKDPMKDFGVATADAQGSARPLNDVLLDLADRFSKMEAGPEKTALALKLFGRAGMDMMPFLSRGKEGLQDLMQATDEYGQVLTGENLQAIKEARAAQRELTAAVQGLQMQLGRALLPTVTAVTSVLGGMAQGFGRLPPSIQAVTVGMVALVAFRGRLSGLAEAAKSAWSAMSSGQSVLTAGAGKMAALGVAIAAVGLAYEKLQQQARDFDSEVVGPGMEKISQSMANNDLGQTVAAIGRVDSAIADLQAEADGVHNPLDFDYRRDIDATKDAYSKLRNELRQVEVQTKPLAQAMGISEGEAAKWLNQQRAAGTVFPNATAAIKAYTEATGRSADASQRAAEADRQQHEEVSKVASSFFGLLDAQKNVRNSRRAIVDAQRSQQDASRGIVDAHRQEEQAARSVVEAQRGYQASLRAIVDAQRQHQASIRAIYDAQRNYDSALQQVEDAERRRIDSLRKVEDAQERVIEAQRKLDDALKGRSDDDELSLERAQLRVMQAGQRLQQGGFSDALDQAAAQLDLRQAVADLERLEREIAGRPADARAELSAAQDALQQAQLDAQNASRGVADAQYGVQQAAQAVSDAYYSEQQAAQGVRDAQWAAHQAAIAVRDAQWGVSQATQAVRDAEYQAQTANEKVAEAQDAAGRAAWQLYDAQWNAAQAANEHAGGLGAMFTQLDGLRQLFPELAPQIDNYIRQLETLQALAFAPTSADAAASGLNNPPPVSLRNRLGPISGQGRIVTPESPGEMLSRLLGRRAKGGPVIAGMPYMVGEQGSELFVPRTNGDIVSNAAMRSWAPDAGANKWDGRTADWWGSLTNSWRRDGWVGTGDMPDFVDKIIHPPSLGALPDLGALRALAHSMNNASRGQGLVLQMTVNAPDFLGSNKDLAGAVQRAVVSSLPEITRAIGIREAGIKGAG